MSKDNRTLMVLARELAKDIGAHNKILGTKFISTKAGSDKFYELQKRSNDAVALAKYLIHQLENRAAAQAFAYAVGMPGYWHQARTL